MADDTDDPRKEKGKLRSTAWFGKADRDGFGHRAWMKNQGLPAHLFDGRPVIGICNTWSELTPCNAHFPDAALHMLGDVAEMRVARRQLGPGVADADHRPAVEDVVGQPLVLHPAAMQESVLVGLGEPGP